MSLFSKDNWEFPIEYDKDCHFYEEYLILDGKKYQYNELSIINFKEKSKYVNGVKITNDIKMLLAFSNLDYMPYPFPSDGKGFTGFAGFNFENGLIPTGSKQGRVLKYMNLYLQKKTFSDRYLRHINSLKRLGKFTFSEGYYVFCDNGNIMLNDEILGNFKKMYDQGKIFDGSKYGGYKNKIVDPYIYGFEKGTKFFGLISDKVSFENISNKDVMEILFDNLYKTGKMSGL